MTINKLHYISQGATPKEHLENIQNACHSGAELVQLRLKNLSDKKILKTALEAREITNHFQTRLIINDHYKIAKEVKADGVHLGKSDGCPTEVRKHLYSWQIIGGTANTLEDCKTLINKEVDYIGLGPFRFTTTKENLSPVLGLDGYSLIIEELKTETPIIAIGGITENDIPELLKTGVSGIAMSGEITRDFNKIRSLNKLLQAGNSEEQKYDINNI
ncbi:thiamine phosphate synthase [Wenyingzhuangia marina]|uniref:Thiamine-phosphate synthase n=1 Tax=Wenyingzhuangia marina TaxID=1195760 RepID=A0A1M5TA87_9FLAO|nr:thiamine phosphate synthase [Wenyingzhuangia marina]GGF65995.1 thiamine-phosphate synthase [Wenyingzhuangia marina]SHH47634.1 thiamine-phosphate diphosphorylase [Wenyingzhuangia marina]